MFSEITFYGICLSFVWRTRNSSVFHNWMKMNTNGEEYTVLSSNSYKIIGLFEKSMYLASRGADLPGL